MRKTHYSSLNETLYHTVLPNGLTVYIVPKPSYHKTYVTLSTPLGSTVTTCDNDPGPLPLGIAHFLEHKLFDHPDMDVSSTFSKQSAQVNAYTMNERTTYLFSCTDMLYENMDTLLQFVFHPTFTQEGIDREIGIIGQEISMYNDDPNVAIYMGLLQGMYHTHPIRHDILGTVESISTITKDRLEEIHRTWYHPNKMVLFVTGQVNPDEMELWLQRHAPSFDAPANCEKGSVHEPQTLRSSHGTKEMDILLPNTLLGIKLPVDKMPVDSIMKWELTFSMFADMLVGKSTQTYQDMLQEGLINDSFGLDITLEQDYGFILFGSQTKQPDAFLQRLKDVIQNVSVDTLDQNHFERTKKQVIGNIIQALNSLEYIANQFTKYYYMNANLFDVLDVLHSITMDDIARWLEYVQDDTRFASYIIVPKQKENR